MIVNLIKFIQKRPGMIKFLAIIAGSSLIIWSIAGADTSYAHTWAEKYIPGFWSLFGFVACIVFIFFAKWFGGSGVQTREDYYDD